MVGDFEEKIGDNLVRLRFGVLCVHYLEEEWKTDTHGVMMMLGKKAMSWIDPLYFAAKNYCEHHDIEFKVTKKDCMKWYEDDNEKCLRLIKQGLESYFPKNLNSPMETGNHIQSEIASM